MSEIGRRSTHQLEHLEYFPHNFLKLSIYDFADSLPLGIAGHSTLCCLPLSASLLPH